MDKGRVERDVAGVVRQPLYTGEEREGHSRQRGLRAKAPVWNDRVLTEEEQEVRVAAE